MIDRQKSVPFLCILYGDTDHVILLSLSMFVFQVNVWTFHDPYVVYGEEKPFQSGTGPDPSEDVFIA